MGFTPNLETAGYLEFSIQILNNIMSYILKSVNHQYFEVSSNSILFVSLFTFVIVEQVIKSFTYNSPKQKLNILQSVGDLIYLNVSLLTYKLMGVWEKENLESLVWEVFLRSERSEQVSRSYDPQEKEYSLKKIERLNKGNSKYIQEKGLILEGQKVVLSAL